MEEKDNSHQEERIGSEYIIKEKLGSGGQANVFLVKKVGSEKTYAAKVFKWNTDAINDEIHFLQVLNEYNNPYIIHLIESGEGEIVRNNRKTKISKYLIMENASNGNIFDYIYLFSYFIFCLYVFMFD